MYILRAPVVLDPDVTSSLATITDVVYTSEDRDIAANAFTHLLDCDDVLALVATLSASANALLDTILTTRPNEPSGDVANIVADNIIGEIWSAPSRTRLARALLHVELDDGSYDSLSPDMRVLLSNPGPEVLITLAQLVTGMSFIISNARHQSPGEALRLLLTRV